MYSGELLRKYRTLLGLKQAIVAKNLEVSQQAVAKIEKKKEVCNDTVTKYLYAVNSTREELEKFINFYPPPRK